MHICKTKHTRKVRRDPVNSIVCLLAQLAYPGQWLPGAQKIVSKGRWRSERDDWITSCKLVILVMVMQKLTRVMKAEQRCKFWWGMDEERRMMIVGWSDSATGVTGFWQFWPSLALVCLPKGFACRTSWDAINAGSSFEHLIRSLWIWVAKSMFGEDFGVVPGKFVDLPVAVMG